MLSNLDALSLDHQPEIEEFLRRFPPDISELTFTNLFIWRDYYRIFVAYHLGFLTLLAKNPEGDPFFFPPVGEGDLQAWFQDALGYLKEKGNAPRIARVPDKIRKLLTSRPAFKTHLDRDNSDYVYKTEKLIRLSGNKYHTLKNHINRFNKQYPWEYFSLTPALKNECLDLQEEWCRLRQCVESPGLLNEEQAIIEAFNHMDHLKYKGGVIRVDGKVEAFTLGELLNPQTVVIHIEKANPKLSGLYALIQQQFLENEWSHIPYVNREQDLGLEGLRKAKLSYNPEFMVNKYIVTEKE
jgi:uncharacterized protein